MNRRLRDFIQSRSGGTAIEYSMIAAFVAILIISSLFTMGVTVEDMFEALLPAFAGPTP